MRSKESGKVRYAYGVAMALLLGGSAFSLATGQAGAQVPQNAPGTSSLAPRPGAPMSFADLVAKLQPAVVNISTKQTIRVSQNNQLPPGFEEFFRQFGPEQVQLDPGYTYHLMPHFLEYGPERLDVIVRADTDGR